MPMFLLVLVALLFPVTAVVTFAYLRQTFELLALVQQDETLWRRLGCPEKVFIRQFDSRVATIKPIMPWLRWIWAGDRSHLSQQLGDRLMATRKLLVVGMFLMSVATTMIVVLFLSAP
jgi:hypothetical protein